MLLHWFGLRHSPLLLWPGGKIVSSNILKEVCSIISTGKICMHQHYKNLALRWLQVSRHHLVPVLERPVADQSPRSSSWRVQQRRTGIRLQQSCVPRKYRTFHSVKYSFDKMPGGTELTAWMWSLQGSLASDTTSRVCTGRVWPGYFFKIHQHFCEEAPMTFL